MLACSFSSQVHLPGSTVPTHYRLEGPPEGHLVVLLHGINNFSFSYDLMAPALAAAGYRILR